MSEIVFAARLTADDWDEDMHGWRCQALSVPGAIVDAIYVEGNRIDSGRYEILSRHTFIRWLASERPQRVAASIRLTEALSLGTETERWKRLAIVLPVMATIVAAVISAGATYLSRASPVHMSSSQLIMSSDTDLPGEDYKTVVVPNACSCQEICQADSKCQAYTYVPLGRQFQGCWLKNFKPPAVHSPGLTSGVRSD